jgi:hypothetical protein
MSNFEKNISFLLTFHTPIGVVLGESIQSNSLKPVQLNLALIIGIKYKKV